MYVLHISKSLGLGLFIWKRRFVGSHRVSFSKPCVNAGTLRYVRKLEIIKAVFAAEDKAKARPLDLFSVFIYRVTIIITLSFLLLFSLWVRWKSG
jgi:hypothetical protein